MHQIMAWCLTAQSHHLNQSWLIINEAHWSLYTCIWREFHRKFLDIAHCPIIYLELLSHHLWANELNITIGTMPQLWTTFKNIRHDWQNEHLEWLFTWCHPDIEMLTASEVILEDTGKVIRCWTTAKYNRTWTTCVIPLSSFIDSIFMRLFTNAPRSMVV